MLKQLIDVKSNKIFVLQTVGKGTSCPACVWQTDLHTGTAAVSEPALSLLHTTAAIYLYDSNKLLSECTLTASDNSCDEFPFMPIYSSGIYSSGIYSKVD